MLCDITPRKSVEDLQYLIKSVRDRGFPYEGRGEKDRNWSKLQGSMSESLAAICKAQRQNKNEEPVPSHGTGSAVGNGYHIHTHRAGDDIPHGDKGLFYQGVAGISILKILLV